MKTPSPSGGARAIAVGNANAGPNSNRKEGRKKGRKDASELLKSEGRITWAGVRDQSVARSLGRSRAAIEMQTNRPSLFPSRKEFPSSSTPPLPPSRPFFPSATASFLPSFACSSVMSNYNAFYDLTSIVNLEDMTSAI